MTLSRLFFLLLCWCSFVSLAFADSTPPPIPSNFSAKTVVKYGDSCNQPCNPPLQDLQICCHSCNKAQLDWDPVSDDGGIQGYKVYRDGKWLGSSLTLASQRGDSSFLIPETNYTYQVSALDNAGNESALSAPVTFTTPSCTPHVSQQELKTAVVLVSFADQQFQTPPFTVNDADQKIFGSQGSVNKYLQEISSGNTSLTGSIFGWKTLPHGKDHYCSFDLYQETVGTTLGYNCSLYSIKGDANALFSSTLDVAEYDRVLYFVNGMGSAGHGGSIESYFSAQFGFHLSTIGHELGHSFSGSHAGRWECPEGLVGPEIDDVLAGDCNVIRYGDPHDTMGGGTLRHPNTYQKWIMGMLPSDQITTVTASGTYFIDQVEIPSAGTKMIRIPLDEENKNFYFLEYRRPIGFNGPNGSGSAAPVEGIQIRLHRDFRTSGSADSETVYIQTLITPGSPFTDPFRDITVEALALYHNIAQIKVTLPNGVDDNTAPDAPGGLRID